MTTMSATKTANGKYSYDKIIAGKTLDKWIQSCHRMNCEKNEWEYRPLKRGAFGYDNIAMSVMKVLIYLINRKRTFEKTFPNSENKKTIDISKLASLVHEGWAENYIFWRDNKPYEDGGVYFKPYNEIGDKRRDDCANKKFEELIEFEQRKDIVFAEYLEWCFLNNK